MKRLVILGGGESGVGAAILGKQKGYEIFVSDSGSIAKKYKKRAGHFCPALHYLLAVLLTVQHYLESVIICDVACFGRTVHAQTHIAHIGKRLVVLLQSLHDRQYRQLWAHYAFVIERYSLCTNFALINNYAKLDSVRTHTQFGCDLW